MGPFKPCHCWRPVIVTTICGRRSPVRGFDQDSGKRESIAKAVRRLAQEARKVGSFAVDISGTHTQPDADNAPSRASDIFGTKELAEKIRGRKQSMDVQNVSVLAVCPHHSVNRTLKEALCLVCRTSTINFWGAPSLPSITVALAMGTTMDRMLGRMTRIVDAARIQYM